jgi:enoyl-CoA hydratase/carnithine racemase
MAYVVRLLPCQVMHELVDAVMALDADSSVRAIIITGRGKAFAAGADIREMAGLDQAQVQATAAAAAAENNSSRQQQWQKQQLQ